MVVEGARVRTGAVLAPGTSLGRSTHVIDTETGDELPRGEVPAWSVCINGIRPRKFPGGEYGMPCVLVIRRLAEGERHDKTKLNEILRDHGADI
jgi:2,3,4,5-tetrahydropyridine-2,6-dicarboxylate N-succinyltransferase